MTESRDEMVPDAFYEEDFRVLTPDAFEFVLGNELKRAMRSQNFVTLLVMEAAPDDKAGDRDPLRHTDHIVPYRIYWHSEKQAGCPGR